MGVKLERFIQPRRGSPGLSNVSIRPSGARLTPVRTPTISPFEGPGKIASTLISSTAPVVEQIENRMALAKKNSKLTELRTNLEKDRGALEIKLDQLQYTQDGEQNFIEEIDGLVNSYQNRIDDDDVYNSFWPTFTAVAEKMKVDVTKKYREKFIQYDQSLMQEQINSMVRLAEMSSYSKCKELIKHCDYAIIGTRLESGIIDKKTANSSKLSATTRIAEAYFNSNADKDPIGLLKALTNKGDKPEYQILDASGKIIATVETEEEAIKETKRLNTIQEKKPSKPIKEKRTSGKAKKAAERTEEEIKREIVGDGLGHTYRDANYTFFDKILPEQRQKWVKILKPKAENEEVKLYTEQITNTIIGYKEQKRQLNLVPKEIRQRVKKNIDLKEQERKALIEEDDLKLADDLTSGILDHRKNGGTMFGAMQIVNSASNESMRKALEQVVLNQYDTKKGKKTTNLKKLAEIWYQSM